MKIKDINNPIQLQDLNYKQLKELSSSIREELINLSKRKKIHLASNLGIVELSIALLKRFNTTNNKIFYDIGHQSYVHKMLTNRYKDIDNIKEYQGISGFQCEKESDYDFFSSGHASNTLSISQGFIESNNDIRIITVIGDASISNGLAFEALNNIGFNKSKMLIILNDNGMSIDKSVGSLNNLLKKMKYNNLSYPFIKNITDSKRALNFINLEMKMNNINFFHNLGFYYIGKVNGHNLKELDKSIEKGIYYSKFLPTIIHVKTIKGQGMDKSLINDPKYHSLKLNEPKSINKTFSEIASIVLFNKLKKNKDIKIITSAATYSSSFDLIAKQFPNNYEDVGISEEHSISKSTGIHLANKKVVVCLYSTFLQRGYDQILNDVSRKSLPVLFLIDRADLSYGDGDTHHGIYDVGMIKSIPNTIITMCSTENELKQLINFGLSNKEKTFFIRFSNDIPLKENKDKLIYGDWLYLIKNIKHKTCIISYGNWINKIYDNFKDNNADILNAIFLKGYDESKILNKIKKYKVIIFYERVYKEGSLYKDILHLINKHNLTIKCHLISFENNNIGFGNSEILNSINNMDINKIKKYL